MNKAVISTRELVLTAAFAALTAVLAQIALPLPSGVPVTLQTFAAALCGYMLGKRLGSTALFVYLLLGAAGLPVFSGLHGGISSVAGVTGGFIWGFIPMAFLCGAGSERKSRTAAVLLGIAGVAVCHICGVIQWAAIKGGGFASAFLTVSAPYLLKDLASAVCAYILSRVLRKRLFTANAGG